MTTTTTEPTDLTDRPVAEPKPRLGRRISWAEFYRERPDLRPDNDGEANATAA